MTTTIGKQTTISWLGHATYHIVTPEQKRLLIDPWVDGNPACSDAWKTTVYNGLDAIFVTHGHFDHINDLVLVAQATGATVVCQYDLVTWMQSKGIPEDQIIGFNMGGTIDVAGVKATMTVAHHSSTLVENGTIIPMGTAVGYVLRFSNDFCVYVTGDTCATYDMVIIGDLYQPDVVLLPIGDYFTMDPRQAAYALKLIRARYAIGHHWGTYPILTGTPTALTEACKEFQVNTQIIPLRPGESVE